MLPAPATRPTPVEQPFGLGSVGFHEGVFTAGERWWAHGMVLRRNRCGLPVFTVTQTCGREHSCRILLINNVFTLTPVSLPSVTVGTQGKKHLILDISSLVRTRTDSLGYGLCANNFRAERTYLRDPNLSGCKENTVARRGPLTWQNGKASSLSPLPRILSMTLQEPKKPPGI